MKSSVTNISYTALIKMYLYCPIFRSLGLYIIIITNTIFVIHKNMEEVLLAKPKINPLCYIVSNKPKVKLKYTVCDILRNKML